MVKKILFLILIIALFTSVFGKLMQDSQSREPVVISTENYRLSNNNSGERNVPDFNFSYSPQFIMSNYYDYFPGSYQDTPVKIQPNGDGIYIAFQARPEAGATRRIYYSYIQNGSVTTTSLVDFENTLIEGFPGIDIDPLTSNPFLAWHVPGPVDPNVYAIGFTYDEYSLLNMPGLWNSVYHPIDNIDYPHSILTYLDPFDEFIWPSVLIGPSPHGSEMRRLYIITRNFNHNPEGKPCENTLITWTDFTHHTEIATFDPENWSYATISEMDNWRANSIRSFRSNLINADGNLVLIGNNVDINDETDPLPDDDVIFVLEAVNLDNGEWNLYTHHSPIHIANPLDPDTHQGYFTGDAGAYQYMNYSPSSNRHNAIVDAHGKLHYLSAYTLGNEGNTWWPQFSTVKHVKFDFESGDFHIGEIYPNLNSEELHLPWQVDDNGYLMTEEGFEFSYPVWWWSASEFFHENYYRIVSKGNWMAMLFQVSIKSYMFHQFNDDLYAPWASVPETYIIVSNDYGQTWKDPIILCSIETPELSGMIPAYWYMGDEIDQVDDDWGRIHFFFFSHNDYGSSVQGNSPDTGGGMYYAAMDIEFGPLELSSTENLVSAGTGKLRQNYPNPFNPTTNIVFNLPNDSRAKVEVYNIKGQLIKTLADRKFTSGEHTVVWNGEDNFNNSIASGVYLYKLSTENNTEIKKMLLLK